MLGLWAVNLPCMGGVPQLYRERRNGGNMLHGAARQFQWSFLGSARQPEADDEMCCVQNPCTACSGKGNVQLQDCGSGGKTCALSFPPSCPASPQQHLDLVFSIS